MRVSPLGGERSHEHHLTPSSALMAPLYTFPETVTYGTAGRGTKMCAGRVDALRTILPWVQGSPACCVLAGEPWAKPPVLSEMQERRGAIQALPSPPYTV